MNILAATIRQSMEQVDVGNNRHRNQPMVAIHMSVKDGDPKALVNMDIAGADIKYMSWIGTTGIEGMQQVDQHLAAAAVDSAATEVEFDAINDATHSDYNLFVLTPDTEANWYEALRDSDNLTGALLTGELSEYKVDAVAKLTEALGFENIFYTQGKACVRIERVLNNLAGAGA
jgi:hypothetical protein